MNDPSVSVRHGNIDLAVHHLAVGDEAAPTLLLLHGLGEATPVDAPGEVANWPGPVSGLDFTGHGASTLPTGGGYTSETLVGDADAALRLLGPCVLWGRGLGAYIALILGGLRTEEVRGVVLDDGPGLAGGSPEPSSPSVPAPAWSWEGPPDPWALVELANDVRPRDYAQTLARFLLGAHPERQRLWVAARTRPPWLEAVTAEAGVIEGSVDDALAELGRTA